MQETIDAPANAAAPPAAAPAPAKHADLLGTASPELSRAGAKRVHYPALDGLRGLAILMVITCHYVLFFKFSSVWAASLAAIGGNGNIGVDLFFVLSGFLITGILIDARGRRNYFRNFYARRTLRIFPLYYGFLAVILAICLAAKAGHPVAFKHHINDLWVLQPWLWTYTLNFRFMIPREGAFLVPHFWTLAIEEQFYLFWPMVVLNTTNKGLVRVCALIVAGSLVLRFAMSALGFTGLAIFVFTPCRADAFAAGALVAVLLRADVNRARLTGAATWVGVASGILAAAALIIIPAWHFLSLRGLGAVGGGELRRAAALPAPVSDFLYTVLAFLFAALIVLVLCRPTGRLGRACSFTPLRVVGGYSYAIYIFHLPVWVVTTGLLARYGLVRAVQQSTALGWAFASGNIMLVFLVAFLSFHLYEKHFLKLKKYFPETGPRAAAVAGDGAAAR